MTGSSPLAEFGEKVKFFYDGQVKSLSRPDGNAVYLNTVVDNGRILAFNFEERGQHGVVSHPYVRAFADAYHLDDTIVVRTLFPGSTLLGELETRTVELLHAFLRKERYKAVQQPSDSPLPKAADGSATNFHCAKKL